MCHHNDDWPMEYETPLGPSRTTPRRLVRRTKSKGKRSARMLAGGKPNSGKQTYLSSYRQRMAEEMSSPLRRKNPGTTATTTNNSKSNRKDSVMPVSTRKSPVTKSTTKTGTKTKTNRRRASKPVVKQGVVLHLVKEPAGKGGFRFDNSHDRDEKLDVTTAYVSQKDMKKTGTFTLNLVAEPKGKGGVRFANSAKEKLDVTTMYLSQADRALLDVEDSVTVKVTEDGVTVTP